MKIAILDDYSNLATTLADWSSISSKVETIQVFRDTLADEDALVERLKPFEIICTMRERTPFPDSLLARLPSLRLLTTTGMHNRTISAATCRARGISFVGTDGTPSGSGSGGSTNEHCWALIFASAKRVVQDHQRVMGGAGRTIPWQGGTNVGLRGKTLSILGFGRLGQALLPMARALGMSLLAWSPNLTRERVTPHGDDIKLAGSLDELLSSADILSIQMVLSERTRHIIGKEELSKMKSSAILINTSRGGLVDTGALVDALRKKTISAAALDVFEEEPLLSGNPFEGLDNITLTPHMAYSTEEAIRLFSEETRENVAAFLEGEREVLERRAIKG